MDDDQANWVKKRGQVVDFVMRVDSVEEPSEFGDARMACLKFMVANEKVLRIQCIALTDQIERVRHLVKKNTIIRMKGAISKRETNPKYNYGDVPFVLMINPNTTITLIRDCDSDNDNDDDSQSDCPDRSSNASVDVRRGRSELAHITTALNNNTAALKELAAALSAGRRDSVN